MCDSDLYIILTWFSLFGRCKRDAACVAVKLSEEYCNMIYQNGPAGTDVTSSVADLFIKGGQSFALKCSNGCVPWKKMTNANELALK